MNYNLKIYNVAGQLVINLMGQGFNPCPSLLSFHTSTFAGQLEINTVVWRGV
ncbi:MAG: hypothetical protein KAW02_05555 [candidate division Zixibacteria bacterium]|nr:hypothetical protein [candidate division Zixibacteria bacterium]